MPIIRNFLGSINDTILVLSHTNAHYDVEQSVGDGLGSFVLFIFFLSGLLFQSITNNTCKTKLTFLRYYSLTAHALEQVRFAISSSCKRIVFMRHN